MKTTELNMLTRLGLMPNWITYRWDGGDARDVGEYIGNSMFLRWLGIILAVLGLVGSGVFLAKYEQLSHPAQHVATAFSLTFLGLAVQFLGNHSALGTDIRKLAEAFGVPVSELLDRNVGSGKWTEAGCKKLAYAAAFILAAEFALGSDDPIITPFRRRFRSDHRIFHKFELAEESWKHYYDMAVGVELTPDDRKWIENEKKLAFK